MRLLDNMRELRDELTRREVSTDEWNKFEFQAKHLGMAQELAEVRLAHILLLKKLEVLVERAEFIAGMLDGTA